MSDYNVIADLLNKINTLGKRLTSLETSEHPAYSAHAYKNANQVINNAAFVDVTYDASLWSTGHVNDAGSTSFTAPEAGRYLVSIHFTYTTSAPTVNFRITDGTYNFDITEYPTVTGKLFVAAAFQFNLVKGGTIKVQANQAGDVNNLSITGTADAYLSCCQVSLI